MELLSLKIIVLTLSGLVRLFFGMIPMVVLRCLSSKFRDRRLKAVISVLMFFGGGVLLATCFLHMMPEVRESFKTALPGTDFPVAEVIFVCGFFFVYMLEDIIHNIIDRRRSDKRRKNKKGKASIDSEHTSSTSHSEDEKGFEANRNGAYQSTGDIVGAVKVGGNPFPPARRPSHETNGNGANPARGGSYPGEIIPVGGVNVLPRFAKIHTGDYNVAGLNGNNNMKNDPHQPHFRGNGEKFSYVDPDWWRDTVIANSQMNLLSTSSFSVASTGHEIGEKDMIGKHHPPHHPHPPPPHPHLHRHGGHESSPESSQSAGSSDSSSNSSSSGHDHHCHSHVPIAGAEEEETSIADSIRNLLIVIAISFHGVFEGLAIGIQPTPKDLWYLFLAVSLHECTILFCIGVELISSKTRVLRMVTYITVVSLVSPLGIAIGIVISENSLFQDAVLHALVVGSFQGLAAGTLLYVCFFEIFASEGRNLKMKSVHILIAMIGFALMASLELMGGHKHGPNGHGASSHALNGSSIGDGHDHDHDDGDDHQSDHHHDDHHDHSH